MKLSDYVMRFVVSQGVKDIFLLPGGGCMHLVDSVGKTKGLNFIVNLHEQACAVAADAYGQYTNNLGVALVTTGPGGTNAVTGVAASYLDSTPCLILSGQVKTTDLAEQFGVRQMGFQELPITRIVEPITKYAAMVKDPATIRYHLEKAVFLARSGRPGPVWIDIPLDVQAATIDESNLDGFLETNRAENEDEIDVESALSLINSSSRPLILVGNGVRLAKAEKLFFKFAERFGIPIQTTWKTMDFLPEDHELYAGRPGIIGQRGANFAIQTCDCLIALGARLDYGQIGYDHSTFAPKAKKIVVEIDDQEFKKFAFKIDIPFHCDVGQFLKKMLDSTTLKTKAWEPWRKRCKDWQKAYPVTLPTYWEEKDFVNQYVFIEVLGQNLESGDLLIPGSSGACCEATMQALRVKEGLRVFYSPGLGSMGFGVAAAIGGCIASGRKRTICIEGDGSFHMNSQELEVLKRENLPIKIFLFENKGYGSIRLTQNTHFKGHLVGCDSSSGLTLPNIEKIAQAYGIPFSRIKDHREIQRNVKQVLDAKGPVICELNISSLQITQPRLSSATGPDGKMVSKPLEDLWPFLDPTSLEKILSE